MGGRSSKLMAGFVRRVECIPYPMCTCSPRWRKFGSVRIVRPPKRMMVVAVPTKSTEPGSETAGSGPAGRFRRNVRLRARERLPHARAATVTIPARAIQRRAVIDGLSVSRESQCAVLCFLRSENAVVGYEQFGNGGQAGARPTAASYFLTLMVA